MAGPLGEMFDHGKNPPSQLLQFGCLLLHFRLRCSQHNSERFLPSDSRSQCSSPLQLEVILASRALNLCRSRWTVSSQMATLANFYLTSWEEYHTGMHVKLLTVIPF